MERYCKRVAALACDLLPVCLKSRQSNNKVEISREDAIWQGTDPLQISRGWNKFSDVTRDVRRWTAGCREGHSLS